MHTSKKRKRRRNKKTSSWGSHSMILSMKFELRKNFPMEDTY
jgi:hypothetical protein